MNLLHILPVLALLWAVVYCQHTPKPITAVLHAKWPRTPLLVEASEFVASEDNSAFWQFVEATTDIRSTVHTDKELYDAVLEQVEPLLSPLAYSLFIFALSLHTYSTTVEMYQQVAMERLRVLGEVDCPAFVDVAGQVACSVEQLNVMLQGHSAEESTPPQLFGFDHRYPSPLGAQDHAPTAVLYAELGTQECSTLHSALAALASEGRTRYVLRHYLKHRSENKMRLSGYGVELAVKSTEYKAVDDTQVKQEEGSQIMEEAEGNDEVEGFLFNTLKARHPSLSQQLGEWKDHLLQGAREMPELRAWQLQDLGYQTSQRMLSAGSDLALKVMRDTAQNLPTLAKSLSRTQVSKELRQEIKLNQKTLSMYGVEPGSNVLLLNGIVLQEDSTDIFNLLDVLLSESRLLTGLQGVGLGAEHTQKLLNLPVHTEHKSFSVDMRSEAVVWINDLEKDRLYSGWPKSLQEFLKPMFPGMLRQIRRNVFNIVFCLDPASPEGAELVEYVKLFLDHVVPARLGVLLVPDQLSESDEEGGGVTEEGVITSAQLIRLFNYLSQHKSAREALRWLYQTTSTGNLTTSEVMATFEAKYGKTLSSHQDTVGEVAGEQSEYDSLRKMSMEFFQGKGFDSLPQVLVNGVQLDLEEDLESSIVSRMQTQTFEIQQAVYLKRVNDSSVMYDYFLDKPNVLKRVNRHVVSTSKQLDLSRAAPPEGYSSFSELSQSAMSAQLASSLHYYSSEEGEFLTKELSVWVLGDIASGHGKELLKNALVFASSQFEVRVAVVHNLNTPPGPTHLAVEAALMSQRSVVAWRLIEALLSSKEELTMEGVLTIAGGVQGVRLPALEERVQGQDIRDIVAAHTTYCSQVLGLEGGASALLSNGRVIGPLAPGESFKVADFQMLYQFESSGHASSVLETVEDLPVEGVGPDEDTAEFRSGLVMQVASLLRSEPKRRRISLPKLRSQHSQIHLPSSDPSQELQLVAVMDPLAVGTQRLAPILQTLHVAMPIDLQLYPNPQEKLSELPIKRFYRYVLEPELSFELDGSESPGPMAVFADLPHSPLLTLQLAVPHSWLVEGVWSPHDLDNIHLAAVERGVHGVFELEHILVEGQCFDAQTDQPIPGLEYSLGTPTQPDRFDTIVMANLGYFQLKAGPGVWTLRLREGRSHDMYTVTSHHGSDSSSTGDNIVVMVNSFRGKGIVVRVAKRPGMEGKHLLYDDKEGEGPEGVEPVEEEPKEEEQAEAEGIWKSLSSLLGGKGEEDKKKVEKPSLKKLEVSEKETINIFSIASGHLYERFLRIMMLSVLKNTRNPVKFWFLKNYLSPTFKDFIPHMARHYGFEYELVQYRWPRWLHAQTEKQRLIWGYKILFLDVLFPLSVKKIIFVDADQTVRADLRELLEIHLHGAPYAYTPFCDSRPDMAGFRFWDRGYWKNHLGNRRYHISALYLVDLWRFRQLAAGDRLRGQYQALSQDPNSLANLDQDLPNNMIHSVPIFSLPQEWLWCETWCTNETKPLAKTIDLCNNPLTKEPKLTSARRIVPEWTSYDAEIQLLQESMEAEQPSKENQDHLGRVRTEDIAGDSQKHVEL